MNYIYPIAAIGILGAVAVLSKSAEAEPSDSAPGGNNHVQLIAMAIANAEGFNVSGSIPQQAHNPGDLVIGDIGNGTLGSQMITVFASDSDGWDALRKQVQSILNGTSSHYTPDESISDIAQTYAGPSGAANWANNVASFLGVTVDTPIGQV